MLQKARLGTVLNIASPWTYTSLKTNFPTCSLKTFFRSLCRLYTFKIHQRLLPLHSDTRLSKRIRTSVPTGGVHCTPLVSRPLEGKICSRDFASQSSFEQVSPTRFLLHILMKRPDAPYSSSPVHKALDFGGLCPKGFKTPFSIALHTESGTCHNFSRT
jgi:hypothetical protein